MRVRTPATLLALSFFLLAATRCGPDATADGRAGGDGASQDGGSGSTDAGTGGADDAGPAQPGEDGGTSDAGPADAGPTAGCGDGLIQAGEACDDGNSAGGDGCSATCDRIEQNWACPTPGAACVSTVVCGDGRISGAETCDDGAAVAGDGCSDHCTVEPGWTCPVAGAPCEAAACGDGIVAGHEECDDGMPPADGDGCSATCRLEPGWVCPAGQACRPTVCGDGKVEGSEPCDDGNDVIGDGCNPFCEVEPECGQGACHSRCGDGMILTSDAEECDDGNTRSGDGCSADCRIEAGYTCPLTASTLPDVLEVPVTFRDFISLPAGGATKHPDFETFSGSGTTGLVEPLLGSDGKPVLTGTCTAGSPTCSNAAICPSGQQLTTAGNFEEWYEDVPGVNVTKVTRLPLARQQGDSYRFLDSSLFPFDGDGWVAQGLERVSAGVDGQSHDFGFTSEVRSWFEYQGGENLFFSGDDDVWVFINGHLAVDLGGLHSEKEGTVTLDAANAAAFGLEQGKVYEMALFHAERHTNASNFNLTLGGFVKLTSRCVPTCGDGVVAGDERCDDGKNDGSYGSCTNDCLGRGPHCGDGIVQPQNEQCDDGVNLTPYAVGGAAGCAPGCVSSAFCGDGKVDSLFGEECDDGVNAGGYGGCASDCTFDARCGDGVVDTAYGEQCDDGNLVSGDGCSSTCWREIIP